MPLPPPTRLFALPFRGGRSALSFARLAAGYPAFRFPFLFLFLSPSFWVFSVFLCFSFLYSKPRKFPDYFLGLLDSKTGLFRRLICRSCCSFLFLFTLSFLVFLFLPAFDFLPLLPFPIFPFVCLIRSPFFPVCVVSVFLRCPFFLSWLSRLPFSFGFCFPVFAVLAAFRFFLGGGGFVVPAFFPEYGLFYFW